MKIIPKYLNTPPDVPVFIAAPASNMPATGPSTLALKVDVVDDADAVDAVAVGIGRWGGAQMPSH